MSEFRITVFVLSAGYTVFYLRDGWRDRDWQDYWIALVAVLSGLRILTAL